LSLKKILSGARCGGAELMVRNNSGARCKIARCGTGLQMVRRCAVRNRCSVSAILWLTTG